MTAREELHQMVDSLAEDQLANVRDYIEDLRDNDVLDSPSLAAIREGIDDIQNGRVMDVEEYRRTRGV
jgi:predicted transcriptional regulator